MPNIDAQAWACVYISGKAVEPTTLPMQADNPPKQVRKVDLLYRQPREIQLRASRPAHASSNHRYICVCQQKQANPMEIVASSYK